MKPEIRVYKSGAEVAEAFASFFQKEVNNSERITISLSGGSTPKLLFQILSKEYAEIVEWSKAHFFWGDERCVPPTDGESNYKMTKDFLFDHVSIPEGNIHRVLGENDPQEEAIRYGQQLSEVCTEANGLPQVDLMILGMGDDGHTASIFPNNMALLQSDKVCDVATHPESGQKRVTLTGPVLNNSKIICFLVTGKKKAEKIKSILQDEPGAADFPAYHIKNEKVIWFLDEEAAHLMNP